MRLFLKIPERFTFIFFMTLMLLASNIVAYKIVNIPAQLEMVCLFAVISFYPVLRIPRAGIYLLFIIMPLIPFFRRLYYLQYSRPSADPLIIVGDLLIAFIVAGLYFEFQKQKDKKNDCKYLYNCMLVYFAYMVFRVFFFNSLPLAEAVMKFRFYGPAVLLFFAGFVFGKDTRMLRNIWIITIISGIAAALYGISQLVFGYTEFEKLWLSSISFSSLFIKGVARPFSFFQSPAAFADYMLLGIIGVTIIMSDWKKKSFLLMLIPVFISALLITSVRSNWIGAIVIIVFWFLINRFNTWGRRFFTLQIIILVFILFQFLESYLIDRDEFRLFGEIINGKLNIGYFNLLIKQRLGALSNPFDEYSFLSRVALWKLIISSASDPILAIFGRGVGGFAADSLYFTYLAEFGYPGMIFIVYVTIIFIVNGFKLLDKSNNRSIIVLAKGIILMNISFGIVNITGTHIHGFPGDIYYWFWNGVITYHLGSLRSGNLESMNENTDNN